MLVGLRLVAVLATSLATVSAQYYQRLGTCPTLGCVLPPDQQDFLPGQYFDLRLEVHAPVNGSEAYNNGVPDEEFSVTIAKEGSEAKSITDFFAVEEPVVETWSFKWYEDLYAEDTKTPSVVNVASKIYRRLALYEPGTYTVTLTYYDGKTTTAEWLVRPLATSKKAKNVILFIGMCSRPLEYIESSQAPRRWYDDQYDHCGSSSWSQEYQRKISVHVTTGPIPGHWPPDGIQCPTLGT